MYNKKHSSSFELNSIRKRTAQIIRQNDKRDNYFEKELYSAEIRN